MVKDTEIYIFLYLLVSSAVDALFMVARLRREEFHHHYPAIKARLMCYSYLGRILLRCHYFISSQLSVFTWRTRPRAWMCVSAAINLYVIQRKREGKKEAIYAGRKTEKGF